MSNENVIDCQKGKRIFYFNYWHS